MPFSQGITVQFFAYLFEAKSIQSYILDSGRLADMVGASELVDALCDDILDTTLGALGLTESAETGLANIAFSRKAGGAFYALLSSKETAEKLCEVWSLVVSQVAPGLEFVNAISSGTTQHEAIKNGLKRLNELRNAPAALLPEAGPLVGRSQRTGLPAIKLDQDNEWLDAPTVAKQQWRRGKRLTEKFELNPKHYVWPRNLESEGSDPNDTYFPFAKDSREVGIV